MTFTHRDYCQYLLSAQGNYTLTHLAEHLQSLSHDTINRFLSKNPLNSADLWANVRPSLSLSDKASIVFDDTVLAKKSSRKIELVRRQYSGNEHRVINGIGLVSCIYINSETRQFWVIDYRIYEPDNDQLTKLDHVANMLRSLIEEKQLPFARVLMDSWYAAQTLMALIDNLGKIYYCPLKRNRLVDDSGGLKAYRKIEELVWTSQELKTGKRIKIKKFPKDKKVQLFRVNVSTDKTEFVATNEQNQNDQKQVQQICKLRWKIEQFHRELKQTTGIEACQCRRAHFQKTHIACAILVWNFLKRWSDLTLKTIYQLKTEWISSHLVQELKTPSIRLELV